jgi:hypothetical protein
MIKLNKGKYKIILTDPLGIKRIFIIQKMATGSKWEIISRQKIEIAKLPLYWESIFQNFETLKDAKRYCANVLLSKRIVSGKEQKINMEKHLEAINK